MVLPAIKVSILFFVISSNCSSMSNKSLIINSIADIEDRKKFRTKLIEYFDENFDLLDEDAKRRYKDNPMRILDSNGAIYCNANSVCEYLRVLIFVSGKNTEVKADNKEIEFH